MNREKWVVFFLALAFACAVAWIADAVRWWRVKRRMAYIPPRSPWGRDYKADTKGRDFKGGWE